MAVTSTPIHVQAPRTEVVAIATANTNLDGATGTYSSAVNAGANGSKLQRIDIKAAGTTTAGIVRIFLYDGSAYKLWKEIPVTAITPSATVMAFEASVDFSAREKAMFLQNGRSLKFSTEKSETFNIAVVLGDY